MEILETYILKCPAKIRFHSIYGIFVARLYLYCPQDGLFSRIRVLLVLWEI